MQKLHFLAIGEGERFEMYVELGVNGSWVYFLIALMT
jgi:hypothetical protein